MVFTLEIQPRFRDIDSLGHVNNAVFLSYLEATRIEWFYQIKEFEDIHSILVHVDIDFKHPILMRDQVIVEMWTDHIGSSSWKFKYTIKNRHTDEIYATASTVNVWFDHERKQSHPIPHFMITELNKIKL